MSLLSIMNVDDIESIIGTITKGRIRTMLDEIMLNRYPDNRIVIHSGFGLEGDFKLYTGARTAKAIKSYMTKERGGGRWVNCYMYSHESELGSVYIGLDNYDQRHIEDEYIKGVE